MIAFGGIFSNITIVSLPDLHVRCTWQAHTSWLEGLALSGDGRLLATCSDDDHPRIWATSSGLETEASKAIGMVSDDRFYSVAFSPDDRWLAAGTLLGHIYLFDIDEAGSPGDPVVFGTSGRCIDSLLFSADGRFLASGADDNLVRIWEVASGRCRKTLGRRYATPEVFQSAARYRWQRFVEGGETRFVCADPEGGEDRVVWLADGVMLSPNPQDSTLWAGCGTAPRAFGSTFASSWWISRRPSARRHAGRVRLDLSSDPRSRASPRAAANGTAGQDTQRAVLVRGRSTIESGGRCPGRAVNAGQAAPATWPWASRYGPSPPPGWPIPADTGRASRRSAASACRRSTGGSTSRR